MIKMIIGTKINDEGNIVTDKAEVVAATLGIKKNIYYHGKPSGNPWGIALCGAKPTGKNTWRFPEKPIENITCTLCKQMIEGKLRIIEE